MYGYVTIIKNGLGMKKDYRFESFSSSIVIKNFEIIVLMMKKTRCPAQLLIISKKFSLQYSKNLIFILY